MNHKMALRPNILADAALNVAFEASIFLQDTDINLFASNVEFVIDSLPEYIYGRDNKLSKSAKY